MPGFTIDAENQGVGSVLMAEGAIHTTSQTENNLKLVRLRKKIGTKTMVRVVIPVVDKTLPTYMTKNGRMLHVFFYESVMVFSDQTQQPAGSSHSAAGFGLSSTSEPGLSSRRIRFLSARLVTTRHGRTSQFSSSSGRLRMKMFDHLPPWLRRMRFGPGNRPRLSAEPKVLTTSLSASA